MHRRPQKLTNLQVRNPADTGVHDKVHTCHGNPPLFGRFSIPTEFDISNLWTRHKPSQSVAPHAPAHSTPTQLVERAFHPPPPDSPSNNHRPRSGFLIPPLKAVMDTVRSTLGPRGMDKLIFDGQKVRN